MIISLAINFVFILLVISETREMYILFSDGERTLNYSVFLAP